MSTADNHPGPTASAPSRFRRWRWRLLLAIVVIGALWLTATRGGIAEFSPYTLQCRWRSEYTILSGSIPVYRSRWHYHAHPLIEHLCAEGIVKPINDPRKQRWEHLFHWNFAWKDGYAELYEGEFRHPDLTIEWCKSDPARAAYYFSTLFQYLRSDQRYDHWTAREMHRTRRYDADPRETLEDTKKAIAMVRIETLDLYGWGIDQGRRTFSPKEEERFRHELELAEKLAGVRSEWTDSSP